MKDPAMRFLSIGAAVAAVTLLVYGTPAGREINESLNRAWAAALYHSLGACGVSVVCADTVVCAPGFAMKFVRNCNGLFPAILVGAAVMFWPAPMGRRLAWLLPVLAGVAAVNFLRLFSIMVVGVHSADAAHAVHVWVWPVLQGALVFAGVWWVVARPRTA